MIDMRMKQLFFDRPKVQRAVSKANRQKLSQAGAIVRTTAQQSIKKAPFATRKPRGQQRTNFKTKTSRPGAPPYSHTGLLKRFIFFAYEPGRESAVIGPAKLAKAGAAPQALEHGGKSTVVRRSRRGRTQRRRVTIKARPFMGPALDKERSKLPKLWANSVRRG